jgi:hypothetical protein
MLLTHNKFVKLVPKAGDKKAWFYQDSAVYMATLFN